MAKSLRSKWKRKMKAVKRERYGKKELKVLNDMLTKAGEIGQEVKSEAEDDDKEMTSLDECETVSIIKPAPRPRSIAKPSRRSRLQKESESIAATVGPNDVEKMAVDPIDRVFSKRTMRDQFGNYPDWMSKKKMRTQQKKNKRLKKKAINHKKK